MPVDGDGTVTIAALAAWPTVRDASRRLDVSSVWVTHLLRSGNLRAVKTKLGWLIDPTSVDRLARERQARLASTRTHDR